MEENIVSRKRGYMFNFSLNFVNIFLEYFSKQNSTIFEFNTEEM